MSEPDPTFFPAPADFRAWLEEHHATAAVAGREVLAGLVKLHRGDDVGCSENRNDIRIKKEGGPRDERKADVSALSRTFVGAGWGEGGGRPPRAASSRGTRASRRGVARARSSRARASRRARRERPGERARSRGARAEREAKKQELLGILREWRIRDGYDNANLWEEHR